MSIQSLTIYPAIKLSKLLLTLENGSRPPGGVGQVRNGIPSLGAEHISTDGKFSLANIKFVPEDFFNRMSRGIIKKHDVLVVKDGATTGKTAFVDDNFPFEKAAVNEHVFILRPDQELLLSEFLFFFLYSAWGQAQIEREFHGGAIGGINQTFADHLEIPLPPLPEQRRIVAILRKADMLRQWRNGSNVKAKELQKALFYEMFGDVNQNTKGWPVKKLDDVGVLDRGRSRHRPRDAAFLYGGKYPFIQTGDVANSDGWITEYQQTYSDAGLAQSRLWKKGTLCITIAANIAKTAILSFDACFPDSLVGFIPKADVCVEYVSQWFKTIQSRLEKDAPQLAQKNINLQILRELKIPIPPMALQKKYATITQQYKLLTQMQSKSQQNLDFLLTTITSRAFTGELTVSWRDKREDELQHATAERDKKLVLRGEVATVKDAEEGRLTLEEEEQLRQALGNFSININQMKAIFAMPSLQMAKWAQMNQEIVESVARLSKDIIEPVLQSIRQSLQAAVSIQLPKFPEISSETILRHIDNLPVPQENRAIIESLDTTTLRVLKLAGTYPAYFTADDLETGEFGGITTLQAEAGLRTLQALGFVKLVQMDGLLRYRLTDEHDYANLPSSLSVQS